MSAQQIGFRGVRAVGLTILLAVAVAARAEMFPPPGKMDSRIRVAPYSPDQVYRLSGFVGYQIDLEFAPGETFLGLGAGDIEGISFVASGNHLFLKPKAATVGTNLTVLTNRRAYHFEYTATWRRPDPAVDEVIYVLRFSYPAPPAPPPAAASAARIDAALKFGEGARHRNYDYWYCGSSALRPIAASDDGIHTRLTFPASAELPAIFVRNDDGSESLLNFSMQAGDVVIYRIARRFVLRRGKLTGCIVNEAFDGSGSRLPSGTVSPTIERITKGAAP